MKDHDEERFIENEEERAAKKRPSLIFDPREPIESVNPFSDDSAEKFARDIVEKKET